MSNRKHKTMLSEHFSLEELTYSLYSGRERIG